VLVRSVRRWRATGPFERLQITPVYVCALLTFLLVTVARAGAGSIAWWAAFISTGLMPFAFLGGLLGSHVSHLDAELHARLEELRASRARLVRAGDAERRRLERDLHDGAQSRLVGLALLLRAAEALANVAKYARATQASVAVRQVTGRVIVEVSDDGVGGADAAHGSGLRGLVDRVATLDGALSLASPAGGGTRLLGGDPLP
jgi:signal transduction histidine kinase